MTSRIASIIQEAESRSSAIISCFPAGTKKSSTATRINSICAKLLKRKTPICPTAKVVSEEGSKTDQNFAQPQTIYNSYKEILNVWNESYRRIMNMDCDARIRPDQVSSIDTATMDVATANIVEHLKAMISELTTRCNTLKRIIDETIPVDGLILQTDQETEAAFISLKEWLDGMRDGSAFAMDELGLRTTRRTPIGAKVMDKDLYDQLVRLADEALRIHRVGNATRSFESG